MKNLSFSSAQTNCDSLPLQCLQAVHCNRFQGGKRCQHLYMANQHEHWHQPPSPPHPPAVPLNTPTSSFLQTPHTLPSYLILPPSLSISRSCSLLIHLAMCYSRSNGFTHVCTMHSTMRLPEAVLCLNSEQGTCFDVQIFCECEVVCELELCTLLCRQHILGGVKRYQHKAKGGIERC